jgi:fructoselysine-6-P-deglycase FrlB-like protein
VRDFLSRVAAVSFRSENSSEYLALLWGYYFQRLNQDQRRTEAITSQVENGLEKYDIGSRTIDYQLYRRLQAKSSADLDQLAFIEAARCMAQEGGQLAVVGMSLESPRRLYVASHNRPIFVVRRLENDDVMVVSDQNAAMGLFPHVLIQQQTLALLNLRAQKEKALEALKNSGAAAKDIGDCEQNYERQEQKLLAVFKVAVYPLEGEEIFARIETRWDGRRLCRNVTVTRFDGSPLPEIEPVFTVLEPPVARGDLYHSYYETHLHEIPERAAEILRHYVPAGNELPEFQLREDLLHRRFGPKFTTLKRIVLVGVGNSYNIAVIAAAFLRKLMPEMQILVLMPFEVEDLSKTIVPETDLAVLLSWASTNADMVAFAKKLKDRNTAMIAVTEKNFADMALIARKSVGVIRVLSGEEVTISNLKSTFCMLLCLCLLGVQLAAKKGRKKAATAALKKLQQVPEIINRVISDESLHDLSKSLASKSAQSYAAVVVGPQTSIGTVREAAAKLEETSWTAIGRALDYRDLQPEALRPDMKENLIVVNATHKGRFQKALRIMQDLYEKSIPFVAVTYANRELADIEKYSQGNVISLPKIEDALQSFVDLAFYYQFAFHYGLAHGRNAADFPRNRVKSVTAGRSISRLTMSASQELLLLEQINSATAEVQTMPAAKVPPDAWEHISKSNWEKQYYRQMRRLAVVLERDAQRQHLLENSPASVSNLAAALSNTLSHDDELILVPLDRMAECAARSVVSNWQRIFGCSLRVVHPDFLSPVLDDRCLVVFMSTVPPDEDNLASILKQVGSPHVWIGPGLDAQIDQSFQRSAGSFKLDDGFTLAAAEALYAGTSLLLTNSWKQYQPVKAGVLARHLMQGGAIIGSILNNASLKKDLVQSMEANQSYRSAFFIGPPAGTGMLWVDRFGYARGPAMEFHRFGESALGPIVTVDSRIEDKFVKLTDRCQMQAMYGEAAVLKWEQTYLAGTEIESFLRRPVVDLSRHLKTPFFAEGYWYLPELRPDYDTFRDNLIIIDATSERHFAQAVDELSTYGCRYARMIVFSQEAFTQDSAKKVLYRYPISQMILLPALRAKDGAAVAVSDLLLPLAMNLLGAATASAASRSLCLALS